MNRTYCIDFDDFCDATVDMLPHVQAIKEKYPEALVTLFTIPARTSLQSIKAARELGDWVKLAPHGWRHTRGECLAWSDDEAAAKLQMAADRRIDYKVFRAPAWLIDADTYTACEKLGYVVASHKSFRIPNTGVAEYVYNKPSRAYRAIHGHLTPVQDNCISDMLNDGRLDLPDGAKFSLPHELAAVIEE